MRFALVKVVSPARRAGSRNAERQDKKRKIKSGVQTFSAERVQLFDEGQKPDGVFCRYAPLYGSFWRPSEFLIRCAMHSVVSFIPEAGPAAMRQKVPGFFPLRKAPFRLRVSGAFLLAALLPQNAVHRIASHHAAGVGVGRFRRQRLVAQRFLAILAQL